MEITMVGTTTIGKNKKKGRREEVEHGKEPKLTILFS
jgi:hypothetical protein